MINLRNDVEMKKWWIFPLISSHGQKKLPVRWNCRSKTDFWFSNSHWRGKLFTACATFPSQFKLWWNVYGVKVTMSSTSCLTMTNGMLFAVKIRGGMNIFLCSYEPSHNEWIFPPWVFSFNASALTKLEYCRGTTIQIFGAPITRKLNDENKQSSTYRGKNVKVIPAKSWGSVIPIIC